tara:strand:+ start:153 stop:629 length:477 start_codon:yes stop_codon:yes gene_type:complete
MSGKYPKTTPQQINPKADSKVRGKSDAYNLESLYPKAPHLNGYNDDDVISIAKKLLNPKGIQIVTPDFPDGITLDYGDDAPDQNNAKQTSSKSPPVKGEGYAPLPLVDGDVVPTKSGYLEPQKPAATDIDDLPNVKKSSSKSSVDVTDILIPGTSNKA